MDKKEELIKNCDEEFVSFFLSYNVSVDELYDMMTNYIPICECSYEAQCAMMEWSEAAYFEKIDNYIIAKYADRRVDKRLELIDFDFLRGFYL